MIVEEETALVDDNDNNGNNNINNNPNGYKLLSPQGMATLQDFLKQHGNECIRQFVQVSMKIWLKDVAKTLISGLI